MVGATRNVEWSAVPCGVGIIALSFERSAIRPFPIMSLDSITHYGIVHGRTIELQSDVGLPDGQSVEVTLRPLTSDQPLPPGEGIRRSAGAWADDADELDAYLEWSRQQRKVNRRTLEP